MRQAEAAIAVVGGSGIGGAELLDGPREVSVRTRYATVTLWVGRFGGRNVAWLPRHGPGHVVPPHRIDYRANIRALADLGVERIVATGAVGSLDPAVPVGSVVLVDQFIDATHGRAATFHDGDDGVVHVDVTEPYCPQVRALLADAGEDVGLPAVRSGTYVCTQGPRFETPAEIRAFRLLGGDVVGMTGVPEVVLARELGICYATVAMVTNLAAGLAGHRLTPEEVVGEVRSLSSRVVALLASTIDQLPAERGCACAQRPVRLGGSAPTAGEVG